MRVKRLLGLLVALALLFPICQSSGFLPAAESTNHAGVEHEAGARHCPTDAPSKVQCTAELDLQLNLSQIAPLPDSSGSFGARPAAGDLMNRATKSQQARAPDLHELSISRT